MAWKKTAQKVLIMIGLLLVLGMFTFLYGFFETATAPYEGSGSSEPDGGLLSDPADDEVSDPAGAGSDADSPGAPGSEEDSDAQPDTEDYVTVRMEPSDVFRGDLLLINHDYRFEIPGMRGLVPISDVKTPSYRVTGSDLLLAESAIEPLNNMMDGFFEETGRDTAAIISAFRDYERQQEIIDGYIATVGSTRALRLAALPGYSEHHAGLAVDLGIYNGGVLRTFTGTGVSAWFKQNSHNYGFILRFPGAKSDITKTEHEPWHFRYIGLPHAYFVHENDWCLEEYIEMIMDHTRDEPFSAVFGESMYEVYYTSDTVILIPYDCEFDISGNNIEGFIVTIKR